jgi:hypothetical protein
MTTLPLKTIFIWSNRHQCARRECAVAGFDTQVPRRDGAGSERDYKPLPGVKNEIFALCATVTLPEKRAMPVSSLKELFSPRKRTLPSCVAEGAAGALGAVFCRPVPTLPPPGQPKPDTHPKEESHEIA